MPKVKVTHALFTYKNSDSKRILARRGDVIDVPKEVFEASKEAFIGADEELSTPGTLVELIDEPGDEHIEQYLHSGSADEIVSQLPKYINDVKNRLLLAERNGLARPVLLAALGDADALNPQAQASAPVPTPKPPAPTPPATTLTDESSDEDLSAFVTTASVDDVTEVAAGWSPELRARAVEVETAGKNRKGVIEGLTKLSQ